MLVRPLRIFILLCALASLAHGEDVLENVQRELRARKLYFGAIDGRASEETTAAVFKFQRIKGLDATGHLNHATLRALGLRVPGAPDAAESALLEACCDTVMRYLRARESGEWNRERVFYLDRVSYYEEGVVDVEFIRAVRAREDARWPRRKFIVINRIASLVPRHRDEALVTARVRSEIAGRDGPPRTRLEDLAFLLRASGREWKIAALKALE